MRHTGWGMPEVWKGVRLHWGDGRPVSLPSLFPELLIDVDGPGLKISMEISGQAGSKHRGISPKEANKSKQACRRSKVQETG